MSTTRRAYDLLRGYVNQEWDRVRGLEMWDALQELNSPSDAGKKSEKAQTGSPQPNEQASEEDQLALARQILNVGPTADFAEIRKSYERQNRRSDPSRFPDGSVEQQQAAEINRRVNIAYRKLTEAISTTEKRFKSLEIE